MSRSSKRSSNKRRNAKVQSHANSLKDLVLDIRRGIGARLGVRQPRIISSQNRSFISLQAEAHFRHRESARRASNLCRLQARFLHPEATAHSAQVQLVPEGLDGFSIG